MSAKTRNLAAGTVATGCIALALILVPALLHGYDARNITKPPGKLIVHEWGTFTSFSGSDGVNLEFRPLTTYDLPRFVMNLQTQPGSPIPNWGKDNFYALQRMETPVTYFYTDVPRTVNVRVDFPKGLLTEWYPVVKNLAYPKVKNAFDRASLRGTGSAYLDWDQVNLIPPDQFANIRMRGPKDKPVPAMLQRVDEKDHYGRARETDSAFVETVDKFGRSHFEKFLFYRGVGNFELPIKLTALGNDRFEVTNSGDDPTGVMLLVRIEYGRIRFTRIETVSPKAGIETALPDYETTIDQLVDSTVKILTAAGLYEKESLAMVNTWRNSWFGEDGTRLLYLVPGKITDKLLPLKIDPVPDEKVRILVGRLETITPEDSKSLSSRLVGTKPNHNPTKDEIAAELKPLGRFAEPAVQFVMSQTTDTTTRNRLEQVLKQVRETRQQ
jgi:hypothetical protein